jgi:hypothetical protein
MAILALNKPMNKWCEFCDVGGGCKIYPMRPQECRTFDCLWLRDATFPDEFKPQKSKVVFTSEHGGGRISGYVDASFPSAWQEKKLYALLKRWAAAQAERNFQVLVSSANGRSQFCRTATWISATSTWKARRSITRKTG